MQRTTATVCGALLVNNSVCDTMVVYGPSEVAGLIKESGGTDGQMDVEVRSPYTIEVQPGPSPATPSQFKSVAVGPHASAFGFRQLLPQSRYPELQVNPHEPFVLQTAVLFAGAEQSDAVQQLAVAMHLVPHAR